jgi:hypothetical protein
MGSSMRVGQRPFPSVFYAEYLANKNKNPINICWGSTWKVKGHMARSLLEFCRWKVNSFQKAETSRDREGREGEMSWRNWQVRSWALKVQMGKPPLWG